MTGRRFYIRYLLDTIMENTLRKHPLQIYGSHRLQDHSRMELIADEVPSFKYCRSSEKLSLNMMHVLICACGFRFQNLLFRSNIAVMNNLQNCLQITSFQLKNATCIVAVHLKNLTGLILFLWKSEIPVYLSCIIRWNTGHIIVRIVDCVLNSFFVTFLVDDLVLFLFQLSLTFDSFRSLFKLFLPIVFWFVHVWLWLHLLFTAKCILCDELCPCLFDATHLYSPSSLFDSTLRIDNVPLLCTVCRILDGRGVKPWYHVIVWIG